jgi:hypothetical protein
MLGPWESIQHRTDGAVGRLQLLRAGAIFKEHALTRTGRYRLEGRDLALQYDDSVTPQTIPILFECDQLLLEKRDPIRLHYQWGKRDRSYPPIAGRWHSQSEKSTAAVWEFRDDGTFLTEKLDGIQEGIYEKRKNGELKINWTSVPYHEEWKIRVSSGHLLITADGQTLEFKKRLAFR